MDEPTIIGKRPIGPSRATPRVGQPTPVAAIMPAPRVVAGGPVPRQEGVPASGSPDLTAQIVIESSSPADVLTSAATPLLLVVGQLRDMIENADVNALRREMVDQLRRFEERAVRNQARGGDVSAARYILCAL